MRRGFVDTREGQVFYLEEGAGEPLMLLHQSPRSATMFVKLIPLLSGSHRTIAVDMLGYGQSAPPPLHDGLATVADLGRNVVDVLDALGIERAHVFGVHTGAQVAAQVAANAPDRVGALVLCAFGVRATEEDVENFVAAQKNVGPLPKRSKDGHHLTRLWMKAFSEVAKHWLVSRNPPRDPEALELLREVSPHRAFNDFLTDDELDFIDRFVWDSINSKFVANLYPSMLRTNPTTVLPRIQAPTLAITPDSPHEAPYNKRGDVVAGLVPDCEEVTLEESDDNMCEFRAEGVAELILPFLRKHALAAVPVGATGREGGSR